MANKWSVTDLNGRRRIYNNPSHLNVAFVKMVSGENSNALQAKNDFFK